MRDDEMVAELKYMLLSLDADAAGFDRGGDHEKATAIRDRRALIADVATRLGAVEDERDRASTNGCRSAWLAMLRKCIAQLSPNMPDGDAVRWLAERTEAVAILRRLCEDHGDNNWDDDLHLADVIDKHLGRHLGE